ncbi:MAG: hypothetical protein ACLFT4_09560 [Bacteroidales bacterium]
MHRKVKHTIAISLVIVLLLPMTIKLFDGLFHHHDHFHCTAKNEKHFHKYHEKCPIPGFELSFFSIEKHFQNKNYQEFGEEQSEAYSFRPCCDNSSYSFLLRAPPIFTGKAMTF